MSKLIYETDEALFEFDLPASIDLLTHYADEYNVDEARELINFIAESSEPSIKIPDQYDYFGYIAMDLLDKNEGSVLCKTCNQTYHPNQLNPTIVGAGKSPFSIHLKEKGGIPKVFGKKASVIGIYGGKGYKCPQGHEVISVITWRT